ncbi:hypothetical protein Tco_0835563 [Tanacetum coccineum]
MMKLALLNLVVSIDNLLRSIDNVVGEVREIVVQHDLNVEDYIVDENVVDTLDGNVLGDVVLQEDLVVSNVLAENVVAENEIINIDDDTEVVEVGQRRSKLKQTSYQNFPDKANLDISISHQQVTVYLFFYFSEIEMCTCMFKDQAGSLVAQEEVQEKIDLVENEEELIEEEEFIEEKEPMFR